MCGQRLDRQKTAKKLVLALRAALEESQRARDRILDRLVVAALEMQKRDVLERAPVAPVKGFVIMQEKRGCDTCAVLFRQHHGDVACKSGADAHEKLQI